MAKPNSKFFYYAKEGGLNNLWKRVTVKYAPFYVRKAPVITQKAHTCKKKKTAS